MNVVDKLTASDAMQVMLIVQACHQRTAPRMDDRDVVKVTAGVWADLFNEYRLTLADLVAGVKKRALSHPEAPEPAEIIHFAREVRRDRDARRGPTADYEATCELKGADTQELAHNRNRIQGVITSIADAKSLGRNA
jgi:hypothetical protein